MSCVFIVVPVVAGAWPFVTAAIACAGAGLGYRIVRELEEKEQQLDLDAAPRLCSVNLAITEAGAVADTLARGETFTLERDGVTATFRRDGRGQCAVHLTGAGRTEAELQVAGRELVDRVRQQFAYARLMEELESRGFEMVEQEVGADQSIRLRVRRWG
jgi:hypothetical protein